MRATAAAFAQTKPPAAPVKEVTDTYFGVTVADPYRYMEDLKNAEATLRRGYSITTDSSGNVIRTVAAARPKSKVWTRVVDGEFESEVLPTSGRSKP